ncbi:MAG: hypothetical protein HVN35_10990 [Methanobacteriaceae archaeon]|nr:hypothetical protein [Methanobacteriaceae archaeon]
MYFTAGLILIIIGWIIQFYKTTIQKDRNINRYFILFYILGVILLVAGNLLISDFASSVLNIISAMFPLLILIFIIKED